MLQNNDKEKNGFYDHIESAEQYIRDMLKEYENNIHAVRHNHFRIPLESLVAGFFLGKETKIEYSLDDDVEKKFLKQMNKIEEFAITRLSPKKP